MGNICQINENGKLLAKYTYDGLNRLIREDNAKLGKTYLFDYDGTGNITSKRECAFTLDKAESIVVFDKEDVCAYNNDELVSFGSMSKCIYGSKNKLVSYLGQAIFFKEGGLINSYRSFNYEYDALGRRTKKGSITYTYDKNGLLSTQSDGISFIYDHNNQMVGIKNGTTPYYFRKNLQGDVIALLDSNGVVVVKYYYDAWGNHKIYDASGTEITDTTHIGHLNPIRYRGYYYDSEFALYYLKSRYYDPIVGRFVSQDNVDYADYQSIGGLNLFAYCGNNPVMNIDTNGCSWNSFWHSVGNWFSNAGKAIWNGVKSVATTVWDGITTAATAVGDFFATYGAAIGAGALAILVLAGGIVGSIFTGGLAGAAILGAGIGFFGGVASNMAIQASNNGLANMDFGAAMKSGGIGLLIGVASGAISFGFGAIGSFYGQMVGNALSNMTIAGLNVGSAFSYLGGASLFSAIGTGAGYLLGSFVGSALGNELMNNLFGYNPSTQENVSEGVTGWIMDGLMKFLLKLFWR